MKGESGEQKHKQHNVRETSSSLFDMRDSMLSLAHLRDVDAFCELRVNFPRMHFSSGSSGV